MGKRWGGGNEVGRGHIRLCAAKALLRCVAWVGSAKGDGQVNRDTGAEVDRATSGCVPQRRCSGALEEGAGLTGATFSCAQLRHCSRVLEGCGRKGRWEGA